MQEFDHAEADRRALWALPLAEKVANAIENLNKSRLEHLLHALTKTCSISRYAELPIDKADLAVQMIRAALAKICEQKEPSKQAYRRGKSVPGPASSTSNEIVYSNKKPSPKVRDTAQSSRTLVTSVSKSEPTALESLKILNDVTPTPEQKRRIGLALQEAQCVLHANDRSWAGWATLNYKKKQGRLKEYRFRVKDLDIVLKSVLCTNGDDHHLYLSQHSYNKPSRTIDALMTLNVLTLDLDIYKSCGFTFDGVSVDTAIHMVLARLDFYEIPRPSYIIFSGRGLQVKWLHQPVYKSAQGEWTKAQNRLLQVMGKHGESEDIFATDKKAALKTQLLRLVGSNHQGSGEEVRVAWVNSGEQNVKGGDLTDCKKYDFNQLVASICNYQYTREEVKIFKKALEKFKFWEEENKSNLAQLAADRQERLELRPKKSSQQAAWEQVNKAIGSKSQPGATQIWQARIQMLERLIELRHGSQKVPDGGRRHAFLWLIANAWAWILHGQNDIQKKIQERVHAWAALHIIIDRLLIDSAIQTVVERSVQVYDEDQGPFCVSDEEIMIQLDMSKEELKRIKGTGLSTQSGRKNAKRDLVDEGVMGFPRIRRETYESYKSIKKDRQSLAAERTNQIQRDKYANVRKEALQLHADGMPMKKIVRILGISRTAVWSYVKQDAADAKALNVIKTLKKEDKAELNQ